MAAHPDIEFQLLEHLRALREELAVIRVKIEGLEQRLDMRGNDAADAIPLSES